MENINIDLQGPFNLEMETNDSLLNQPSFEKPGIYFWTVKHDGGFYVNYIGISSQNMKERFFQHVRLFLVGKYDIYATEDLKKAKINKIYNPTDNFQEFLFKVEYYIKSAIANLKVFNYFFATINMEKDILELIESECITSIRGEDRKVKGFLSNYRLSRLKMRELNINVRINTSKKILGIPNQFNL